MSRRFRAQQSYFATLILLISVARVSADEILQPKSRTSAETSKSQPVGRVHDWPQWGGSSSRNNTPEGKNIATEWDIKTGKNIKWAAELGTQSYGTPIVANSKVYIGTNNGAGYLKRYPADVDLSCLLCFAEATGKFLWQYSAEKLPTGRVHDYPLQGMRGNPLVEEDRLWLVTNRGEVVCLDTEGFHDGENDGPFKEEPNHNRDEADIVWRFDMMRVLGISQHEMCSCSVTSAGDRLFVITGNGVDQGHITIPAPNAPSFLCLDKRTGRVLWSDNSPGANILHGQWSSPAWGTLGGVEQVLFGGGDGWLYSFDPRGEKGKSKLLWKFDCNRKDAVFNQGRVWTRNEIIAAPVIHEGRVYIATGQDPEHGEGPADLWCLDPTRRGDVSLTSVVPGKQRDGEGNPRRFQALRPDFGDTEQKNSNAAVIWHYRGNNPLDKLRRIGRREETMNRTVSNVAIKNGLLIVPDFSGIVHCLDIRTGKAHWTHDMLAAIWGSPLIVENHVYLADDEADVTVFELSPKKRIVAENSLENGSYSTPTVANNTLYIASKDRLYAIQPGSKLNPPLRRALKPE